MPDRLSARSSISSLNRDSGEVWISTRRSPARILSAAFRNKSNFAPIIRERKKPSPPPTPSATKKRIPPLQKSIPKLITRIGANEAAPATAKEPSTNFPVRESLTDGLSAQPALCLMSAVTAGVRFLSSSHNPKARSDAPHQSLEDRGRPAH